MSKALILWTECHCGRNLYFVPDDNHPTCTGCGQLVFVVEGDEGK